MKKMLSTMMVMVMLLLPIGGWNFDVEAKYVVRDFSVNDLRYTIENNEVTITGCYIWSTGDAVIPDTIEGYPVTSIGNSAFRACSRLTSVTIPDSVTSIGTAVFEAATKLTNIAVGENNPAYCSEDGVLFNKAKTQLIAYPTAKTDTAYTIPDGVTSIEAYAFAHSGDALATVTIPDSVTSIGKSAFFHCDRVTSIVIPGSVSSIGESAFWYCDLLANIVFLDGVTNIDKTAFAGCVSLNSITIPKSLTRIDEAAFEIFSREESIDIWYGGSEADRAAIAIADRNNDLTGATWHYNTVITAPTTTKKSPTQKKTTTVTTTSAITTTTTMTTTVMETQMVTTTTNGAEVSADTQPRDFPWWVVIVGVGVLVLGVVGLWCLRKQKAQE